MTNMLQFVGHIRDYSVTSFVGNIRDLPVTCFVGNTHDHPVTCFVGDVCNSIVPVRGADHTVGEGGHSARVSGGNPVLHQARLLQTAVRQG